MADEQLLQKIHGLGDLDLAALLCLVSREHCIISTDPDQLDNLTSELRLVALRTFNLQPAIVDCTPATTLDDLAASIQLPPPNLPLSSPSPHLSPAALATPRSTSSVSPLRRRTGTDSSVSYFNHARHGSHGTNNNNNTNTHPQPRIANIILARNLDRAPQDVQIQCLELLRTRRILTRTGKQEAPKQFLFIAVLESSGVHGTGLVSHLNDYFYVSHWHDPEDGFVHLDEEEQGRGDEYGYGYGRDRDAVETASLDSASSVVRRSIVSLPSPRVDGGDEDGSSSILSTTPISIGESDIASLAQATRQVHFDIEVLRYQMNMVSFLRMHRFVAPGGGCVTPLATKHFAQLARCLAAAHGLDYVTPSLIALAARKIYPHRIRIATAKRERSMQWGSDLTAVESLLDGVGPDDVIDDVLATVAAPL